MFKELKNWNKVVIAHFRGTHYSFNAEAPPDSEFLLRLCLFWSRIFGVEFWSRILAEIPSKNLAGGASGGRETSHNRVFKKSCGASAGNSSLVMLLGL